MREDYHKQADVLGVDVALMRPEKATVITVESLKRKGNYAVYFLCAADSLYCQNQPKYADGVNNCDMVFPGDYHTEMAAYHRKDSDSPGHMGAYARAYFEKLFNKLNHLGKEVHVVSRTEEDMQALIDFLSQHFDNLNLEGTVYHQENEGEAERVVNEINGRIPDVVLFALTPSAQLEILANYKGMINASLCIYHEALPFYVKAETQVVPRFFQALHLDRFYLWLRREGKIRNRIIGTMFRKQVLDKQIVEESQDESDLQESESGSKDSEDDSSTKE